MALIRLVMENSFTFIDVGWINTPEPIIKQIGCLRYVLRHIILN